MPVTVRSFAKINLGLRIGPRRPDGYHELATVYQTLAWGDRITIAATQGRGIEIGCDAHDVPVDRSNTCYRIAESFLQRARIERHVSIAIAKSLPVQGGLGAASSNAVATLLGLERETGTNLPAAARMDIAAAIGSDLPLFLVGGTVLGTGRGEVIDPAPELPPIPCVVVTPRVGVSTPQAFADWDRMHGDGLLASRLTGQNASDTITSFSSAAFLWLNGFLPRVAGLSSSGVPVQEDGGRVETLLLGLVRTGIVNDFEQVVFPQHPEVAESKRELMRLGARYASLSGSGSSVYGLFSADQDARQAAEQIAASGIPARATNTLPRQEYWDRMFE
jgi:4-diphosphocytidyl-2-C-methyl-D-erythritol kinase